MSQPTFVLIDGIGSFSKPITAWAEKLGYQVATNPGILPPLGPNDIIWCDWADPWAVTVSQAARPCPVIVRCHGYEVYYPGRSQMDKIVWENVNRLVFVAPHLRNHFRLYMDFTDEVKTVILRDSIDIDAFPLKKDIDSCNPGLNIAWVGRICPPKNVEFLIGMAYELEAYQFHFMGPFEDRRCETFFHHHNSCLPNTYYHEPGNPDDFFDGTGVNNLLENCRFIASPSYAESTHLALMEGMSKGLVPLVQARPGTELMQDEGIQPYCCGLEFERRLADTPHRRYRDFVAKHHSHEVAFEQFKKILEDAKW